jgi:hypothetical protein
VVLNSINHIRQANLIRQASVYPDIFSSESENELWVWMQEGLASPTPSFWLRLARTSCCGSRSARNPAEHRRHRVFSRGNHDEPGGLLTSQERVRPVEEPDAVVSERAAMYSEPSGPRLSQREGRPNGTL